MTFESQNFGIGPEQKPNFLTPGYVMPAKNFRVLQTLFDNLPDNAFPGRKERAELRTELEELITFLYNSENTPENKKEKLETFIGNTKLKGGFHQKLTTLGAPYINGRDTKDQELDFSEDETRIVTWEK